MSKNELKTNFNMSYADLSAISKQKVATITRDIVEFQNFGISQEEVNAFFEEVRVLDRFFADEYFVGEISSKIIERNNLRARLQHQIRIITASIMQIYQPNDAIFKQMRVGGLTTLSHSQLFRTGEALHITLVSILPVLESCNITQDYLDSFYALIQDYSNKITNVNQAVNERNKATQQRISLANAIYHKLVIYTRIGRTIWEESNEALYNDYFISSGSSSAPPSNSGEGDEEGLPNG